MKKTEQLEKERSVKSEMSFWDHLGELKSRLRISVIIFVVSFFIIYIFSSRIFQVIKDHFIGQYDLKLLAPTVMSGFMLSLKMGFWLGLGITLPVLIYEVFKFIDPALNQKYHRLSLKIILSSATLFLAGMSFVYFVMLPMIMDFFIKYNEKLGLVNLFSTEQFFTFIIINLFVGGVIFQTPMVIVSANRLGLLHKDTLKNSRRWAYIIILVLAGVLTPDHSIISQIVLGGVIIVLFEFSLLFCK
ncbi:MAG: twin-arginine translocase subunit TatC [Candidatus Woesearchaeota archaeon]